MTPLESLGFEVLYESRTEQPAMQLDPADYVMSWSGWLGVRAGFAVLFWGALFVIPLYPNRWTPALWLVSLALAGGFTVSFAGMIYARAAFDRANIWIHDWRGVPAVVEDDMREIERTRGGRQTAPLRIVTFRVGAFGLTSTEVANLKRMDNINRPNVKAAISAITNDNYSDFVEAMEAAGLWLATRDSRGRITNVDWTEAGREWRKS